MEALDHVYGLADGCHKRERAAGGRGTVGAGNGGGFLPEPRRVEEGGHDVGDGGSGSADDGGGAGLVEVGARGAGARRRAAPAAGR